jgi:hypothetical protein
LEDQEKHSHVNRPEKYDHPEVFFHVGLGKVASKYLQYYVFPRFKNIRYIPTTRFYKCIPEIRKGQHPSYLVSREFDNQFAREVTRFAKEFPDAHPILLLRRHDDWIASQYRRSAKNGFTGPFTEFIDLEKNTGKFTRESLDFYGKIELLEKLYGHKPLVLIYDDLLADRQAFLEKIANYCNATFDREKIPLQAKHKSYTEKQIRFMQWVSRFIPFKNPDYSKVGLVKFFQRIPVMLYRYSILYTAILIPAKWLNKGPLIPPEELKKIHEATREDWEKCLKYSGFL